VPRLTGELNDAREQQAATADVLKVISHSTFDLQAVLDTLVKSAARLCRADMVSINRPRDGAMQFAANFGLPQEFEEIARRTSFVPGRGTVVGRVLLAGKPVQIADVEADREFAFTKGQKVAGFRTVLGVPLEREGETIGVIVLVRTKVRPFTDKQIELVRNFAAQAVIAIDNTRLLNELRQSLEQQTATADVLRVISSSPGDLEPVFQAMLDNATRICEAVFGSMLLREGDAYRRVALHNAPQKFAEFSNNAPILRRGTAAPSVDRAIDTRQAVHILDVAAEYPSEPIAKFGGARTLLVVPMLKEGEAIGVFGIYRQEVRPFTDKQIELVQNFAAQAVIAIENTRLLNELRQSLQQQTATADVLKVISHSTFDLQTVLDTLVKSATQLCEAHDCIISLRERDQLNFAAHYGPIPVGLAGWPIGRGWVTGRAVADRIPLHIHDLQASAREFPDGAEMALRMGHRTVLAIPLMREDDAIGAISMRRTEVRPFSDKQIELVKTFADQAVIAIENVRLFEAEQQRTRELSESLEQQTATSEVLRVISSSPGELEPVFNAMLENAVRLCDAKFGNLFLYDGATFRAAALYGASSAYAEARRQAVVVRELHPGVPLARLTRTKEIIHVADARLEKSYIARDARFTELVDVAGARSFVIVPMLKETELVGAFVIYRQEVRPFTDKQIALVTNFAAQAVIAIENTRLLNELRESLQQQTATADVLKVISRSTFDLRTVLQALVESAARLCDADKVTITRERDGALYRAEAYGFSREFMDYARDIPIKAERGSASGRALLEGRVVHIPDVKADPEYTWIEAQRLGDYRTILSVPMLREGIPIGVLVLTRPEVRPFTDKQIELVTTFADQAAIAIKNVQLFDEIQDKSRQLEEASQHKSQFLANMSHELRTPLNAILGYTELMADGAYGEPSEKMLGILQRLEANGKHLLGLINDVLDLSKIEAGQLVLELSDYSIQDIAQTVRSTLEPLASDKKLGFKVEIAPQLPSGHGDGRRLTQVLINLVGNAIKFTDAGEVAIKAEAHNGSFHVSVRDTGPGISSADQARLFQEFQQADNAITKKKGGTGLGLAISKRIIEMHGGRIWVESQPGQGSTFTFTLPVIVERQV
jgi:GAF domain-containing protein